MRKSSGRRPPRPATWNSPKGNCRFCGEAIVENGKQNKRKNWHRECVRVWNIMSRPSVARNHVWHHDRGICQDCGQDSWKYEDKWEVDHKKPLCEATDLSYWHPDNLQLMCSPCHKQKTAGEATRRALNKKPKEIDQ